MKKKILILIAVVLGFYSCIDETYFGESSDANIVVFNIKGQLTNTITIGSKTDTGRVSITIPNSFEINNLEVVNAQVSTLARFLVNPLAIKDFSNPVILEVVAENGAKKIWKISLEYGDRVYQLPYSKMNLWTKAKDENGADIKIGDSYAYFPGEEGKYSPWQHSARANKILGFVSVNPLPYLASAEYASIETKYSLLGGVMKASVVAGALFTGDFVFDIKHAPGGSDANPRKMINFGTPFYEKPSAVKFKMRYARGLQMKDGENKDILENDALGRPTKDSCEIYFILQNRRLDDNKYYRVGAAWLRTSDSIGNFASSNGFVEVTLPFIYNKPSATELSSKPYMNIGGQNGEVQFYKFIKNGTTYDKILMNEEYPSKEISVDNIIVVFSSSAYGDMFWGAPGSKLDVKDIEFVY